MNGIFALEIGVPKRLSELAAKNAALFGPLSMALSEFSIWLADNKTPFFYDYTDHGIAHVTNVLRSAESIISKRSWSHLSAQDACAIIAAVLLHDCAMHLSEDGFFRLLAQDLEVHSTFLKTKRSWRDEYFAFEQEAARWDSSKLMSVFGDTDAPERLSDSKALSQRQRLLVGEFLRRHHARLAHEIAILGVPGVSDDKFAPFGGFTPQVRDFYGFLARSHNLNIRRAADAIPPMQRRRYLGVHAPFVMAVLRIADYIQIDSARAPTQILQLRGLKSPISRQEWAKHHAVIQLDRLSEDPEALTVITDPPNVRIFVGLRLLFADLQRELDESWAALGEVYGRFDDLNELGLTVRRIRTNLDDVKEFESQSLPPYVPQEIRLTTASAELLHLLVGPLYGNKPTVGVREMLQNAVDATLERNNYLIRNDTCTPYIPHVSIDVDLSPEERRFSITDNGVGMELETLELFFLKAGASFRRSKWWKGNFADENGGALVRRSGRFGIGALASFLIGPVVEIRTRHFLDKTGQGIKLRFTLNDDLIQVERANLPCGTSITIPIESDEVAAALAAKGSRDEPPFFGWYLYKETRVDYRIRSDADWLDLPPSMSVAEPIISRDSVWTEVRRRPPALSSGAV